MKKMDIAMELEKLKGKRESVPPVASTEGAKPKKEVAKETDAKRAKELEYPTKPAEVEKKKTSGKSSKKAVVVGGEGAVGVSSKMSKKDLLMKMLNEMSDSE
jgi:hypothetical protein